MSAIVASYTLTLLLNNCPSLIQGGTLELFQCMHPSVCLMRFLRIDLQEFLHTIHQYQVWSGDDACLFKMLILSVVPDISVSQQISMLFFLHRSCHKHRSSNLFMQRCFLCDHTGSYCMFYVRQTGYQLQYILLYLTCWRGTLYPKVCLLYF